MIKKTIAFNDLDGNPISEDFYFNLNKAEAVEVEFSRQGGLSATVEKLIVEKDNGEILSIFKELLTKSVGRRSADNRRFIKNQEIVDDFVQTDAYSELLFELGNNADVAADFITGLIPAGLKEQVEAEIAGKAVGTVSLPEGDTTRSYRQIYAEKLNDPSWTPSPSDLQKMDKDQIAMAFQRKASQLQKSE